MQITTCPQKEIGSKMMNDVNLAVHASKGLLPEVGGILDQNAKFIHTWQSFQADKDLILEERRRKNGK